MVKNIMSDWKLKEKRLILPKPLNKRLCGGYFEFQTYRVNKT
jgi:hypothetical protein